MRPPQCPLHHGEWEGPWGQGDVACPPRGTPHGLGTIPPSSSAAVGGGGAILRLRAHLWVNSSNPPLLAINGLSTQPLREYRRQRDADEEFSSLSLSPSGVGLASLGRPNWLAEGDPAIRQGDG